MFPELFLEPLGLARLSLSAVAWSTVVSLAAPAPLALISLAASPDSLLTASALLLPSESFPASGVRMMSVEPPSLVSNLQDVLMNRRSGKNGEESNAEVEVERAAEMAVEREKQDEKPIVLVTSGDGIESSGLTMLETLDDAE